MNPLGLFLEPPGPLLTHLHTVYMGYSERLPTRLNPLAKRTCFYQVLEALDGTLLPHCENYQLHVCSALNIGPGARPQVLHREDAWNENIRAWSGEAERSGPKRALIVATMWARPGRLSALSVPQRFPM